MNKATIIDIVVPQEVTTTSINHIIKQHHISQRMRRKLKNDGHILINNNQANWDTLIHGNDHLVISIKPEQEFTHTKMNLDIVYEDDYILVINKAAGVLMHPTSTVRDGTLANGVLYYYDETEQAHDFHPVHRLDKDTSGIVIIAKTSVVQHAFDKQRTKFQKVYDAIVEGTMPSQSLTINYPIGRKPGSIIERCCTLIGKPARTDVTVLTHHIVSQPVQMDINMSTRQVLTHVQCVLHTGRTHQIRVHLSHLGFPLAGDDLYGGHLDYIRRQALHAGYLAFTHPMTQEYIELRAPMPTDMKDLLYL
ncbi:MAG: RluA family pseudouridine synthase [Veillonella atypica]|nr:RluA family pseudouridine synthase [Veillonella atypica]